jgi:hypothetical protein
MLDRRKLLARSGQILLASQFFVSRSSSAEQTFKVQASDFYIIGGLTLDRKTRVPSIINKSVAQDHFLVAIHERTGTRLEVPVPFAPHSVLLHPTKLGTVVGVPNDGIQSEAVEVDLNTGRVTHQIKSKTLRGFYGHGVVLTESSVILLVEFETDLTTSISVRDCNSYKELNRFENFAANPHALSLLPGANSQNIAVCFPDCLAVIELNSGKILGKLMANDPTQRLAHIEHGLKGETIVLSSVAAGFDRWSTSGKIFRTHTKGESLIQLPYPKPLPGEALSSAIDSKTQTMLVTHQDCDTVSLWDLNQFKCIDTLPLSPRPRGVAFDPESENFMVSNIDSKLFSVASGKQIVQTRNYAPNSSHFLRTRLKV